MMTVQRLRPIHMGLLASILAAACILFTPSKWLEPARQPFFDSLTQSFLLPDAGDIVVVDIDAGTVSAAANQTWDRSRTADLVARIAREKPAVIAVDLLFSQECDPASAANRALAEALGASPSILGFLVSSRPGPPPGRAPPLAVSRPFTPPAAWFLAGSEAPCPIFQSAAAAVAGAFLIGDEDGRVRRIQAFSVLGSAPYPTLALEAARRFLKAGTPILGGAPPWLRLGRSVYSLAEEGNVRLIASNSAAITRRTVSAADLLAQEPPAGFLTGKLVLLGSSLPDRGGLRSSAAEPLVASVQLHADLAHEFIAGFAPTRLDRMVWLEAAVTLVFGMLIALLTVRYRPVIIALGGAGLILFWLACAVILYWRTALLADGVTVAIALGLVLAIAMFSQYAETRRAERIARQRFSQYLPQSVVDRYIDDRSSNPHGGVERQITALFTDIEDFSKLAGRVSPQQLVSLLNVYFSEVNALVSKHGGMVDKVVGDAVHAFFNAPEDLADHVNKAIDCALAIQALTEEMRRRPDFAAESVGRTRIGIETGKAVLGEIGVGGKLDYTAHGNAINLAARLQDANKFLGTSICIGPDAAAESGRPLRPLGEHEIRGFGTMPLFTTDGL